MLSPSEKKLRHHAGAIFSAGVAAVDPQAAVQRTLRRDGAKIFFANHAVAINDFRRFYVIGAGKAAASMALGVQESLGDLITGGLVVTKDGHGLPMRKIQALEAGHPLPDARGEKAAEKILQLAQNATADDLLVCLISGGGSALLPLPASGLSLDDERRVTDLLLASGATIEEMNVVRKHLSAIKGGQLARAAFPAKLFTLVLSDVIGDPLDIIASGPTVPDSSSFAEARKIMMTTGVWTKAPDVVRAHIEMGCAGEIEDNPKPGDGIFMNVRTEIVGNNAMALEAAERHAHRLGYNTLILSSRVQGEARDVGRFYAAIAHEIVHRERPVETPACVLAGGETTVTLRSKIGKGGRNQELALSTAIDIDGLPGCVFLAAGTDGTDGPTEAAGAFADGKSIARAKTSGLMHPTSFLRDNDSYNFFKTTGDLFITGPTRTNVMDLHVLLVGD
jgi:hydroxypyruvate reductase